MDKMWICGIDSDKDIINIHMDEDSINISIIDEQGGIKFGGIEAMEIIKTFETFPYKKVSHILLK